MKSKNKKKFKKVKIEGASVEAPTCPLRVRTGVKASVNAWVGSADTANAWVGVNAWEGATARTRA